MSLNILYGFIRQIHREKKPLQFILKLHKLTLPVSNSILRDGSDIVVVDRQKYEKVAKQDSWE